MHKPFWKIVNAVIKRSDVLLLLLDARLIQETRNEEVEKKVEKEGKPIIYVITKADLMKKSEMEEAKKNLHPSIFVSAKEKQGTLKLRERIMIEAKRANGEKRSINVGVLGYPNVGKSSLINAMKGRHAASTSILSGHTKGVQNIRADKRIMLLDTPGVIPYMEKDDAKHAFIGTKDYAKIKQPDMAILDMMDRFPGVVEKAYKMKVIDDKEETLEKIALKKNMIKKGNEPDTVRMARSILKDWQEGKLR